MPRVESALYCIIRYRLGQGEGTDMRLDGRDRVGGRTNGKGGGWNFHPPETYKIYGDPGKFFKDTGSLIEPGLIIV